MKSRPLASFFLVVGLACGCAAQAGGPRVNENARIFKDFTDRAAKYLKMEKSLEGSLPALKPTKDATQIVEHQRALAGKIAEARRDAHQGDIFTPEVTALFLKVIRGHLQKPEGKLARKTMLQDDPPKAMALHVNDVFPEDIPVMSMPPNLLSRLPILPKELVYRIVGHDLTLQDVRARIVVDLIPKAIP